MSIRGTGFTVRGYAFCTKGRPARARGCTYIGQLACGGVPFPYLSARTPSPKPKELLGRVAEAVETHTLQTPPSPAALEEWTPEKRVPRKHPQWWAHIFTSGLVLLLPCTGEARILLQGYPPTVTSPQHWPWRVRDLLPLVLAVGYCAMDSQGSGPLWTPFASPGVTG